MAFISIGQLKSRDDGKWQSRDGGNPMIYLNTKFSRIDSSSTFRKLYSLNKNIEVDIENRVIRMKLIPKGASKEIAVSINAILVALKIPRDTGIIRLNVSPDGDWLYSETIPQFV
ncbi:hypothetical protein GB989_05060 [Shigella sonnei]|nr:hypothetical protein [Shigella sonnei]